MKIISKIEEIGKRLANNPNKNSPFEPPYGTFNVGTIEGGAARNATAGWCNFDWEFRPMPGEDNVPIISEIEKYAEEVILPPMKSINKSANIDMTAWNPTQKELIQQKLIIFTNIFIIHLILMIILK